ncbi:stage III sporulation protein AG [Mechercharimyces sp. CAU 1602]|uniref:stage III sporulation protein AG n=1 Tax=Mechercharimyces sp. CAU 1602 TaxID=2973933 RepID=UPI0021632659|nr:stage III sporulation protein AG [Mechercharimyces sp. CAU 1602]MCS1350777.1 stage III sporulation protein AG [Mechercharimyces sp. CAU 1602]
MLKRLLDRVEDKWGTGRIQAIRWILLVGCVGLAVMIVADFFQMETDGLPPPAAEEPSEKNEYAAMGGKRSASDDMSIQEYEEMYEDEMTKLLEGIVGVEEVSVMINLDASMETVIEKDRRKQERITDETDQRGGSRKIHEETEDEKVVIYKNGETEAPLVIKKVKPNVRGVLVVARGAENLKVKAAIIEAIERSLDVPAHRISVMPKG